MLLEVLCHDFAPVDAVGPVAERADQTADENTGRPCRHRGPLCAELRPRAVLSKARQQQRDAFIGILLVRRPYHCGSRRGDRHVGGRRRCDICRVLHGCWRLDSTCRYAKQQWKKHQKIPHGISPSTRSLAKGLILAKSCILNAQPRELPLLSSHALEQHHSSQPISS